MMRGRGAHRAGYLTLKPSGGEPFATDITRLTN